MIKNNIGIYEKLKKICIIFIGFIFLMGFYDDRNIYVDLEEFSIELGDTFPSDKRDYITSRLSNNLFLEDNVPKDIIGQSTMTGTYEYYIVYRDEERKYSRLTNKKSTISVIDTIKPEIKIKENELKFEYGSKINVDKIAICYDLAPCKLSIKENIDTKKAGTYEITVLAVDESNNTNEKVVSITIKEIPRYDYYGSNLQMNNYNNNLNSGLTEEEKMSLRYQLIEYAKLFEGNPYVYGGNSLTNGIDCSAFVKAIYAQFGYRMPRSALSQNYMGKQVSRSELLPGDVVAYRYDNGGGHVGIYLSGNLMIHAGTPQTGIIIAPIFPGNITYRRIIY